MNFRDGPPKLMGIVNATPDSFSDGGRYIDPERAIAHGLELAAEGADIIDVGGESTRPGAERVPAKEQMRRVLEVIRGLRAALPAGTLISIDTTLTGVAEPAIEAGAGMLNDVSAGREDPRMLALAAESGLPLVLMHMQGTPATMQAAPHYDNAVEEIREFLLERARAAEAAGVDPGRILIDPGIGFGKEKRHNLELMAGLARFVDTGYPVLLGTSRKRFMGSICKVERHDELVGATCATTALGVMAGVRVFRVHDVKANRQAADVAWAIRQAG